MLGSRACLLRVQEDPETWQAGGEGGELVAGWLESGVSVGFWEPGQEAAGNVGFTEEEPEGQRAIFASFLPLGKGPMQDLNAGLKRRCCHPGP